MSHFIFSVKKLFYDTVSCIITWHSYAVYLFIYFWSTIKVKVLNLGSAFYQRNVWYMTLQLAQVLGFSFSFVKLKHFLKAIVQSFTVWQMYFGQECLQWDQLYSWIPTFIQYLYWYTDISFSSFFFFLNFILFLNFT